MDRLFIVLVLVISAACGSSAAQPTATPAPRTPSPTLFITTSPPTPSPTASPSPDPRALRYVAIGASDTVGIGASDPVAGSWPSRLAARLPTGSEYVNLGVSGSLAAQAGREQLPRALEVRPRVITIWLAVNDLNANVPATDYAVSLRAIVMPLLSGTDARVFIGNVPDLRSVPAYAGTDRAGLLARINAYNAAIAAVAATTAAAGRMTVVDLFTGSAALTSTITVSGDGFHPSDAGYALIADRFAAALLGAGLPLR